MDDESMIRGLLTVSVILMVGHLAVMLVRSYRGGEDHMAYRARTRHAFLFWLLVSRNCAVTAGLAALLAIALLYDSQTVWRTLDLFVRYGVAPLGLLVVVTSCAMWVEGVCLHTGGIFNDLPEGGRQSRPLLFWSQVCALSVGGAALMGIGVFLLLR